MRILVNALSVSNASGRHVLLGHLARSAAWTVDRHRYVVLHHPANGDLRTDLGPNVEWLEAPRMTGGWLARSAWERSRLGPLVSRLGADLVFTPAGTAVPGLAVPQVVFAQNPWCLVPGVARRPGERLKASLQRRAYREAMRVATTMVFNSEYMRTAYRANAGFTESRSEIVHQAVDDETHAAAARSRSAEHRRPLQIVSVSAMAAHKGVETLVSALAILRRTHGIAAELALVGEWPDRTYERRMRALVQSVGLGDRVVFAGRVPLPDLHRHYAEARVFCLMSRCESFGIPAVEAQAFGTPVVSSNCCAIPEICGDGGVYPEPGDAAGTAAQLARLLTDEPHWQRVSTAAVRNADKYRWDACARPFPRIFDDAGRSRAGARA